MDERLISLKETATILGVVPKTLREWDDNGTLKAVRTKGGHRRYRKSDIENYLGVKVVHPDIESELKRRVVIYGRVSSHDQKQKGDLDRQCQRLSEYCAKQHYTVEYIIKDVGSGLSDARTGFNRLLDLAFDKKISRVVIENKDRLTRFQFNILVRVFNNYSVEIECVDKQENGDEAELVNDIMMLMASFSGKLYGRRSAKRRKEKKTEAISDAEYKLIKRASDVHGCI